MIDKRVDPSDYGRMRKIALLAALLFTSTALADEFDLGDTAPPFEPQTPWYLPRDTTLGVFFNGPDTLALRVTWEFVFAPERNDELEFVFDGGGGWALSVPHVTDQDGNPPLDSFFEHMIGAGLGYRRTNRNGFYWGAQVTFGPLWYGARSKDFGVEHWTVGAVEGRVQLGWWLGKVATGLSIGLNQPTQHPPASFSYNYVGGFQLGAFAHWL